METTIVELAGSTLVHLYGAILFGIVVFISTVRYFYKKDRNANNSK